MQWSGRNSSSLSICDLEPGSQQPAPLSNSDALKTECRRGFPVAGHGGDIDHFPSRERPGRRCPAWHSRTRDVGDCRGDMASIGFPAGLPDFSCFWLSRFLWGRDARLKTRVQDKNRSLGAGHGPRITTGKSCPPAEPASAISAPGAWPWLLAGPSTGSFSGDRGKHPTAIGPELWTDNFALLTTQLLDQRNPSVRAPPCRPASHCARGERKQTPSAVYCGRQMLHTVVYLYVYLRVSLTRCYRCLALDTK